MTPLSPASLGLLAALSDGRPHTAVAALRRVHASRIATGQGLRDALPASADGRLGPLVDAGLLERVGDRQNSFFLTARGHDAVDAAVERARDGFPALVERLVAAIEAEIGDPAQARMFAVTRLANVWELADGKAAGREPSPVGAGARLLMLAMAERLAALLERPRGAGHEFMKEVHDQVTDYYYSRLMALLHEGESDAAIPLEGLELREVAEGLHHGQLRTKSRHGPIFLNVLWVDPARRRLHVEDVSRRAKEERFITAIAGRTGAQAVVSAGYFIFSEKGYDEPTRQFDPVGLCLEEGKLLQPPVFLRGSLLVGPEGAVSFRRIGLQDVAVEAGGKEHRIAAVNVAPEAEGEARLLAYNNVWGARVEARSGEVLLTVVNGIVTGRDSQHAKVPLNGFVLRVPPPLVRSFRGLYEEALPMALADPELRAARAGVAAGPMLLSDGRFAMNYAAEDFQEGTPPVTFSGDRTIDRNLIPRCGIGTKPDGSVVIAIVDGRQPHLSVGATLVEFANLMRALGATSALNLDGGGTAAMQVGGEVVSNPSTSVRIDARGHAMPAASNAEKNVRPLATAILVQ